MRQLLTANSGSELFRKIFRPKTCILFLIIGCCCFLYLTCISKTQSEVKSNFSPKFINFSPDNDSNFECADTKISNLYFPICIYSPEEDIYVSKMALNGQYFEKDLVEKFIGLFRIHDDVTFVDLGANLGVYTLPISHLGRHVVAVEPNPSTYRRLAKSIHLGGVTEKIDALNIAIANESSAVVLGFDSTNRGDTFLLPNGSSACKPRCIAASTQTLDSLVPLIRNKKVIMKVDTQTSEIRIFTKQTARTFFDRLNVLMIMMEFDQYQHHFHQTEARRREVDRFLEFFFQRNFEVYDPRGERKLSADWMTWSSDVMFKKADLPTDKLFTIGE